MPPTKGLPHPDWCHPRVVVPGFELYGRESPRCLLFCPVLSSALYLGAPSHCRCQCHGLPLALGIPVCECAPLDFPVPLLTGPWVSSSGLWQKMLRVSSVHTPSFTPWSRLAVCWQLQELVSSCPFSHSAGWEGISPYASFLYFLFNLIEIWFTIKCTRFERWVLTCSHNRCHHRQATELLICCPCIFLEVKRLVTSFAHFLLALFPSPPNLHVILVGIPPHPNTNTMRLSTSYIYIHHLDVLFVEVCQFFFGVSSLFF